MNRSKLNSWWREWRSFILFLSLMLFFRTSIADWNVVPTGSMLPTIQIGDRIWVNKLAYDVKFPLTESALLRVDEPKRGDIVVFKSPRDGTRLVKRLIGLPGDQISMANNKLFINNKKSDYELALAKNKNSTHYTVLENWGDQTHSLQLSSTQPTLSNTFAPVTVPAEHYFFMGDNRDNSADSRFFGFVSREKLIGKAEKVLISLNAKHYYLPRKERFLLPLN